MAVSVMLFQETLLPKQMNKGTGISTVILDKLCVEMGAIYYLDKGYVDFFRLFSHIHKNGAFFVTRAKDNMLYEVVESRGSAPETGIIGDEIIKLTRVRPSKRYPETPRIVTYEDFATGKICSFISSHSMAPRRMPSYSNLDCSLLIPDSGTCQEKVMAGAIINTISQTLGFVLFEKVPINSLNGTAVNF